VLRPVLAHAGHHLGWDFYSGLSDGGGPMSDTEIGLHLHESDLAPGDEPVDGHEIAEGIRGYLIGLGLATLITVVAFFVSRTSLVWQPSIPIALMVLAIAQMGVHLVFFLHITTGAESFNNVLALAFGVLIVFLLIVGSLWIMTHLNHNMVSMEQMLQMQR
jgi:cytochrome o ubiquinol oxidase operon protein cyoD